MIINILTIVGGLIFIPSSRLYQKHRENKRIEEYYENKIDFKNQKTLSKIIHNSFKKDDDTS